MNVVVVIEGREAIPVRAIPFLTDWNFLYPDVLAHTLAGTGGETQSLFGELHAYRREGGKVIGIPESWWASFAVRELTALSEQIKSAEPSHEVGYQKWRDESLAKLRGGAFVWKDELEAFHRSNWDRRARVINASFSQDDEGEPNPPPSREIYELLMASKRRVDSWRELDFSPWIVGAMCSLVMDGFEPEQAAKLVNWLGSEKEFTEVSDLFNRIAAVNLEIEYWETRDDTRASDAKVKCDTLRPLYAERDLLEQRKRELRGDYTESYPMPQGMTPSPRLMVAGSAVGRIGMLIGGTTPSLAPAVVRRNRKPAWATVAMPYMKQLYSNGNCKSAKAFHRALLNHAGEDGSPFKKVNGSLYCPDAGTEVAEGTLGTKWAEIRGS